MEYMLKMMLLATVLAAIAIGSNAVSYCEQDGFKKVWEDNFDSYDNTSWTPTLGYESGQGRDAFLTADNIEVANGVLTLWSRRNETHNFTSAAVTTKGKHNWRYGRMCVRAILPGSHVTDSSNGVWPAHWMMPDNTTACWPDAGELDIMEMIDGDGMAHGTTHWNFNWPVKNCTGDAGNGAISGETKVADWDTQYHEYGIEWLPDSIKYSVDGVVYASMNSSSVDAHGHKIRVPTDPFYIILNTAVDGPWPKPANNHTVFPVKHVIDRVTVGQQGSISMDINMPLA